VKVDVFILEEIAYPEKFVFRLPETKQESPPCGSNCADCPMREKYDCPICPAVV
jgi:hypothetical protein